MLPTATLCALLFVPNRGRAVIRSLLVLAIEVGSWLSINPSAERGWETLVAVLPCGTVNGGLVTMHNIRNFDYYGGEHHFVPRYCDQTLDLNSLDSVDRIADFWTADAIAHVFVSVGFGVRISSRYRSRLARNVVRTTP